MKFCRLRGSQLDDLPWLDAPAHLVEHGYGKRWDFQVVGEEDQFPVGFRVVIAHLPQKGGKGISRFGERGLAGSRLHGFCAPLLHRLRSSACPFNGLHPKANS